MNAMQQVIAAVCNGDRTTIIARTTDLDGGKLTPQRAMVTIKDCLTWYAQNEPQEEPA